MSGLAQVLRQEGEQRGMQEGEQRGEQRGMQRGIQRGEAAVLMRQLQIKFGPLAEQERQKIESADAKTLLEWSERILTANCVEEIFKG